MPPAPPPRPPTRSATRTPAPTPVRRPASQLLAVDQNEPIRLSKRLSELGLCSRREADDYITRGWVEVDGQVVNQLGSKVTRSQQVQLGQQAARNQAQRVTILLNKPPGFVSTQPEDGYREALELIVPDNQDRQFPGPRLDPRHLWDLSVAGRLDIDSRGLLVLTQNGAIAKQLIGEDRRVDKEYLVRVRGDLRPDGLALLRHGLSLDGEPLLPAEVTPLRPGVLRFVLREGKKRQIRRMCEAVGLQVTGLERVRIGRIWLGNLQEGMWRFLMPDEHF
jgi:23S rRNA pseudouridine2604 synthase